MLTFTLQWSGKDASMHYPWKCQSHETCPILVDMDGMWWTNLHRDQAPENCSPWTGVTAYSNLLGMFYVICWPNWRLYSAEAMLHYTDQAQMYPTWHCPWIMDPWIMGQAALSHTLQDDYTALCDFVACLLVGERLYRLLTNAACNNMAWSEIWSKLRQSLAVKTCKKAVIAHGWAFNLHLLPTDP